MFHHFHNETHPLGQGSISEIDFRNIIKYYTNNFNVISADIYLDKILSNKLDECDVCITFDDNLKCQYEIALPVLDELNLKAFWFVYTSPLNGSYEKVELFRYFRSIKFDSFLQFYNAFFNEINHNSKYKFISSELDKFNSESYLSDFSFYTKEDKIFRYTRDILLGESQYFEIMDTLLSKYNFKLDSHTHAKLWINSSEIKELHKNGHIIGLHSHTHPTKMEEKIISFNLKVIKLIRKFLKMLLEIKLLV